MIQQYERRVVLELLKKQLDDRKIHNGVLSSHKVSKVQEIYIVEAHVKRILSMIEFVICSLYFFIKTIMMNIYLS